jgi:predicted DNA-binding transcriptional regulator YafY
VSLPGPEDPRQFPLDGRGRSPPTSAGRDRSGQLRRDLTILRQGGWEITNVAAEGSDARYALTMRDNRIAVLLTPGGRVAVRLALAYAELDRSAPPPFLGQLQHAVTDACLTSFTYRGTRRTVHPVVIYATSSGWVLSAREEGSETAKKFAAAWMGDVEVDDPATATRPPEIPRERLDPMTWELDAPVTVTLGVLPAFVDDALHQLPGAAVVGAQTGETLIEVQVSNRAAFRAGLYALGLRVRVLAPPGSG